MLATNWRETHRAPSPPPKVAEFCEKLVLCTLKKQANSPPPDPRVPWPEYITMFILKSLFSPEKELEKTAPPPALDWDLGPMLTTLTAAFILFENSVSTARIVNAQAAPPATSLNPKGALTDKEELFKQQANNDQAPPMSTFIGAMKMY